eukprot:6160634-Pyramimonas_sp.AAC.1
MGFTLLNKDTRAPIPTIIPEGTSSLSELHGSEPRQPPTTQDREPPTTILITTASDITTSERTTAIQRHVNRHSTAIEIRIIRTDSDEGDGTIDHARACIAEGR